MLPSGWRWHCRFYYSLQKMHVHSPQWDEIPIGVSPKSSVAIWHNLVEWLHQWNKGPCYPKLYTLKLIFSGSNKMCVWKVCPPSRRKMDYLWHLVTKRNHHRQTLLNTPINENSILNKRISVGRGLAESSSEGVNLNSPTNRNTILNSFRSRRANEEANNHDQLERLLNAPTTSVHRRFLALKKMKDIARNMVGNRMDMQKKDSSMGKCFSVWGNAISYEDIMAIWVSVSLWGNVTH